MSSAERQQRSEYVCLDSGSDKGYVDGGQEGARLYHVAAECRENGKFAFCEDRNYEHKRELTCVMGSK